MDAQLASIYGTGNSAVSDDDLEKTAAAELLVKIAGEQGIDLNQFSDEQVMEMVYDLTKTASEGEEKKEEESPAKEKKEEESPAKEKKEEEKVAEADFLGRVMAHAYVQELGNIEKQAGAKIDAVKGALSKALNAVKGAPAAYSKSFKGRSHDALRSLTSVVSKMPTPVPLKTKLMNVGRAAKIMAPELAALGGAAALGTGGYMLGKKKESSALDTLAEARAEQMLEEAGYTKTASSVEQEVELRALQMLEASGYPVEWNQ